MHSALQDLISSRFSILKSPTAMHSSSSLSPDDASTSTDGALIPINVVFDDPTPFHPEFCHDEANIVLASCEKSRVFFRLHSFTLKTTSGWFRSLLSLPQSQQQQLHPHRPHPNDVLYLDEDPVTLEHLFRMISGLPILPIASYDLIESILYAAEKYDMPGPPSILRTMVVAPIFMNQPFRLYSIACRYGWVEEARTASECTLKCNIHSPEYKGSLQKLPTDALLDLMQLHRGRRDVLRQRLDDPPFVPGGVASCVTCDEQIDYHTWRELKYKIILEMDVRPLGDSIVDDGLSQWPEARACWRAKCPNSQCDRVLYDKAETTRVIRECIENLPRTV